MARFTLVALLFVLALQVWFLGWVAYWKWENPHETAFMQRERVRLQQKTPKARLKHEWVPYTHISVHLKRAVIAAEDAHFVGHEGVDWTALKKAYLHNQKPGKRMRGGSTISQQLAKNLFLSSERSYLRKLQELMITYMIETVWTKDRILEVYLNVAEWGDGVFGAQAAARHYYGVPASHLSAAQSARMATYLPNPKRYGRLRTGVYLDRRAAQIRANMRAVAIP